MSPARRLTGWRRQRQGAQSEGDCGDPGGHEESVTQCDSQEGDAEQTHQEHFQGNLFLGANGGARREDTEEPPALWSSPAGHGPCSAVPALSGVWASLLSPILRMSLTSLWSAGL